MLGKGRAAWGRPRSGGRQASSQLRASEQNPLDSLGLRPAGGPQQKRSRGTEDEQTSTHVDHPRVRDRNPNVHRYDTVSEQEANEDASASKGRQDRHANENPEWNPEPSDDE